jgi:hypothetical protein
MKTKLFIEISEGFGEYIYAKGLKLTTRKELSYCIDELLFYLENNGYRNVMDFDEYKVLNYYHFLVERQTKEICFKKFQVLINFLSVFPKKASSNEINIFFFQEFP